MKSTIELVENLSMLQDAQLIFIVAIMALGVVGFALYVVLSAINNKNGDQ